MTPTCHKFKSIVASDPMTLSFSRFLAQTKLRALNNQHFVKLIYIMNIMNTMRAPFGFSALLER